MRNSFRSWNGPRLRKLRESRDWSRRILAAELRTMLSRMGTKPIGTSASVMKWESSATAPDENTIAALGNIFAEDIEHNLGYFFRCRRRRTA